MNLVRLPRVIEPFAKGPKLKHLLTNCTLLSSYNIIYSAFKYPSQNHYSPSNKLKHVTFVHTDNSDPFATNDPLQLIAFHLENITGTFGCSITLTSRMLLPIKPPAIIQQGVEYHPCDSAHVVVPEVVRSPTASSKEEPRDGR